MTIASFQVPVLAMAAGRLRTLVRRVSEDVLEEGEEAAGAPIEYEPCAIAILHSGRVDDDVEHQTERVDQDVNPRSNLTLDWSAPLGVDKLGDWN